MTMFRYLMWDSSLVGNKCYSTYGKLMSMDKLYVAEILNEQICCRVVKPSCILTRIIVKPDFNTGILDRVGDSVWSG
jgi:hypothetical protein